MRGGQAPLSPGSQRAPVSEAQDSRASALPEREDLAFAGIHTPEPYGARGLSVTGSAACAAPIA